MLSINTNLPSLIAQKSLMNSTQLLNKAVERMSTGFKLNHASDNAANYSISTNMTTKIGAYQVAEDNVAMGMDMLTTASGSLDLINNKLSRLRALAEQSANGTYGEQSLNAINNEARALMDEIIREKNNSEYNGQKLFGETVGADMSKLAVNSSRFIEDVEKRNTQSMTQLSSVNESAVLAKGTYAISSADELAKLARMQNSGKITAGSDFVLGADIDLSGITNWTPIGWENGVFNTSKVFSGTFDGNGYTIKNLDCEQNSTSAAGLFGSVKDSVFKNIGFENVKVKGLYSGSLVGYVALKSEINIDNCFAVDVNVMALGAHGQASGGLVGGNGDITSLAEKVTLSSCYTSNTQIYNSSWGKVGGIIGTVSIVDIKDCFSEFDIKVNSCYSGGICGLSRNGRIDNCYSIGNIDNTNANSDIGGIVSGGDQHISNCTFEGNLNNGVDAGGIHGNCYGAEPVRIENCYVKANIKSKVSGGIAGLLNGKGCDIKNCHFEGSVSNTGVADSMSGAILGKGKSLDLNFIEDCTYNKKLTGDLPVIGNDLGVVKNVTDSVRETILQVGIYGNKDSQISFDTFFNIDELNKLYIKGVSNNDALGIIDTLTSKVSSIQTSLGASENRLESALDEISTQYENLISSRSTLRDADIAEVSSEYIRQQILQQASATLLSTANQTPALALQLL